MNDVQRVQRLADQLDEMDARGERDTPLYEELSDELHALMMDLSIQELIEE
jgi:hypothetical protein